VLSERPGLLFARAVGRGVVEAFGGEAGGHRWQRVPPTERRGRVQSSTVTVAVLPEPDDGFAGFSLNDVEWEAKRGHGKGGQHRNKTESAVRVVHRPSGLSAECQSERSQHANRAAALAVLRARVYERALRMEEEGRNGSRRAQVGSGMRGDKRRTVRMQDGQVVDHLTGRRWPAERYLRGEW
jgi:peptide chain release factor 1